MSDSILHTHTKYYYNHSRINKQPRYLSNTCRMKILNMNQLKKKRWIGAPLLPTGITGNQLQSNIDSIDQSIQHNNTCKCLYEHMYQYSITDHQ